MARKARRPGAMAKKPAKRAAKKPATVRGQSAANKAKVPAKAGKPAPRDSLDALIAASAQALALPCDPAWVPAIKMNLQVILSQAALVDEFVLPDDTEPAPVFEA